MIKEVTIVLVMSFASSMLANGTVHAAKPPPHRNHQVFQIDWCKRVGEVLEYAIETSFRTQSYEVEVNVLVEGLKKSRMLVEGSKDFYFQESIRKTLSGLVNYPTYREQAFYLRNQTRYALDDLYYFDQEYSHNNRCFGCGGDHGPYVITILERTLMEGLASGTDDQEVFALEHGASTAIKILNQSRYRRSYVCAIKELGFALNDFDIINKRNQLREAVRIIRDKSRCW